MELVFLRYLNRSSTAVDIQLSDEYLIDLQNSVLNINPLFKRLDNFFGNRISNVTAFVGKNGIGKTSQICRPLALTNHFEYEVIVFKTQNNFEIYLNPKSETTISNNTDLEVAIGNLTEFLHGIPVPDKPNTFQIRRQILPIYFSTSISDPHFNTTSIHSDISTVGLIGREWEEKTDTIFKFRDSEMNRQLTFLNSEIGKKFSDEFLRINPNIIVNHNTDSITPGTPEILEAEIFKKILIELSNTSGSINIDNWSGSSKIVIILWTYATYLPKQLIEDFFNFLSSTNIQISNNSIELIHSDKFLNFNTFIEPLIQFLNTSIDQFKNFHIYKNYSITPEVDFSFSMVNWSFETDKSMYNDLFRLFNRSNSSRKINVNYHWQISNGEYSMLSFFSRLFTDDLRWTDKSIILILDEGDQSFHPEWSRNFINAILVWIPLILSRAKSLQVVLTTHSPYILSDLPSKNVFSIQSGKNCWTCESIKKQTFASNINDLLNDGFFMNKTVGKFAEQKINEFIAALKELIVAVKQGSPIEIIASCKQKIDLMGGRDFVSSIGDSVVKEKLLQMYFTGFEENSSNALIAYYEQKISLLKRQRHD